MHNILKKKYFDMIAQGQENISSILVCCRNWLRLITLCEYITLLWSYGPDCLTFSHVLVCFVYHIYCFLPLVIGARYGKRLCRFLIMASLSALIILDICTQRLLIISMQKQ